MGPISIWVLVTAKEKRSNGMKTCSRVRKNEDKCKQYRCLRPEVAWISATLSVMDTSKGVEQVPATMSQ